MSHVLFFDGECGICASTVRWLAKIDHNRCIDFAPLQGELSRKLGLSDYAREVDGTVVLWSEPDGPFHTYSDAVIEAMLAVGGVWSVARVARLVPKPIRDGIYRWVSNRRRNLSAKLGACPLPQEDLSSRMRD